MKDPRCLIDAEALASHVSIVSASESKPMDGATETGQPTRKRKAKPTGSKSGNTQEQSSASQLKESQSQSETSKMS